MHIYLRSKMEEMEQDLERLKQIYRELDNSFQSL
jgi:hypothetical protein